MGLLDALSTGERRVETLPLMFALSTQAPPWELPNVTSGESRGANMISVDQLISRLKRFVPSESVAQTRGNHLTDLSAYPGIKEGETQWDWMQRTDDFGNDRQGFGEIKETITKLQADPGAVSDKYVRLNGIMTSTENAARIMALPEEELKAQLLSDRALSDKRKQEVAVNKELQAKAEAEIAAKPKTRAQEKLTWTTIDNKQTVLNSKGEVVFQGDNRLDVNRYLTKIKYPFELENDGKTRAATGELKFAEDQPDYTTTTSTKKTRAQRNAERIAASGKTVGTDISEREGRFYIHKGEELVGSPSGYATRGAALAAQQQLAGGSTPSLTGIPGTFATTPTTADQAKGDEPVAINPELALQVERTSGDLIANADFINALFQAYHGRDATQEELDKYVGQNTGSVRETIRAGAPTPAPTETKVPTLDPATGAILSPGAGDAGTGTGDGTTGGGGATGTGDTTTNPRSSILPGWIDLSDFTDEQIAELEALWTGAGQNTNLVNDALSSVGDISISDEDMQKFLEEATEFYSGQGSYYAQTFQRLGEDFQRELDYQAKEREAQIAQTQLENLVAQEQQAEGFAEAGTARSGIRKLAEQRLAQQQEGIRESQSRQFGKSITDYGRKVEEQLGSANLTGVNIPTVGGQGIFSPTAGIRGSLEREQETAIQLKAQELAQQIAEGRAESLASRGDTTIYE